MIGKMYEANYLYIIFVLLLSNVHNSFTYDEYENDFGEVIFAHVLFRHGDRTPIDPYPTDPYKNLTFWPEGYGQLTNIGKEQEYQLGQLLRKRYSPLVGEYNKKNIYVQSTDVDRTLMSAECLLAGMFPPDAEQKWDQNVPWQPIPVHTIPEHLDKVLASKAPCPKYDVEMEKVLKSQEIQDLNEKYKGLYDYISFHAGREIQNITEAGRLYDILLIETTHNLTLPSWTKSVYPHSLSEPAIMSFVLPTWNKELARLKKGLLLKEMIYHMKQKSQNQMDPDRNLWFYAAHDSTLANFLNMLGVFELNFPTYASAVLLELRMQNSHPVVTLFYHNTTSQAPYLLTIPGCTAACPLDHFIALTKDMVPENWELECHAHYLFDFTSDLPYNNIAIFAMVTSALLIFLLVTSMTFYWQRRKRKHWYHKLKTDNI